MGGTVESTITRVFDTIRQVEAEVLDTRLFWVIAAAIVASVW
jgi:hypothetical protein